MWEKNIFFFISEGILSIKSMWDQTSTVFPVDVFVIADLLTRFGTQYVSKYSPLYLHIEFPIDIALVIYFQPSNLRRKYVVEGSLCCISKFKKN